MELEFNAISVILQHDISCFGVQYQSFRTLMWLKLRRKKAGIRSRSACCGNLSSWIGGCCS